MAFIVSCTAVLFGLVTYLFVGLNIAGYTFAIEQKVCMMLLLLLLSLIKISLYFSIFLIAVGKLSLTKQKDAICKVEKIVCFSCLLTQELSISLS